MTNLFISPKEYLEGTNISRQVSKRILKYGKSGCIIGEINILDKFAKYIKKIENKIELTKLEFNGECTKREINKLVAKIKENKFKFVIGLGGGKALDATKAVANVTNIALITIPTSAATCAAVSSLSAMYTDSGISSNYLLFDKCPDLVVIDYGLIMTSTPDLFSAGMGDAISKYYEANAYTKGIGKTVLENVALDITKIIYEKIFKIGPNALRDFSKGILTENVKDIIRTNIVLPGLIGGIGGEGCRAVAAHAINNGLTRIPRLHKFVHGQTVAFGNIIQLELENKIKELNKLKNLYNKLNLPYNFKYFNTTLSYKELDVVVNHAMSPKETLRNLPFKVTKEMLCKVFKKVM